MPTTTPVDLSDSALWRNGFPDELFAELRRDRPIFHHELTDGVAKTVKRDFWMTTKHRHAQRIHRDTDAFTAVDGPLIQGVGVVGSAPTIINMDPPDLVKRRRVMSHAFTPKAIGKLEEGIRTRAAAMIDRLLAAGGGDWIEDVADVLPMSVIGDIIGIPDEDRPEIFDTFDRILKVAIRRIRGDRAGAFELFGKIFAYALELTAEKRRNPADDIWSTLTSAVVTDEDGEQLSIPGQRTGDLLLRDRLRRQRHHEERAGLRTAGVRRQSVEIERYRTDEAIRPSAVEEVLRWSSPVAFWTRSTKVDVEMDGVTIPKGDGWWRCCAPPIVTKRSSTTRSRSTSAAPTTRMSRSAAVDHTIASARCWPAPRSVRCSTNYSAAPTTSASVRPKVAYPNLTNNMSIFDEMAIT